MQPPSSDRVTIATLNTLGLHVVRSRLPSRYKLIAEGLEKGDVDVVCVQEVATYWHLRLLARRMPSFRHVSYQRAALGPAGALVTFSRLPVARTEYHRIGPPRASAAIARLPLRNRLTAGLRGALVTRLGGSASAGTWLAVVNTHTTSNKDGDWSEGNRHHPVHRAQLAGIAAVLRDVGAPAALCGDFNIPRQASLLTGFLRDSRLSDAFAGACPPTFRTEYLPAGETAQCVDFILTTPGVTARSPSLLFADKHPALPDPGYLSDHIGLTATLIIASRGLPGSPAPVSQQPRPSSHAPRPLSPDPPSPDPPARTRHRPAPPQPGLATGRPLGCPLTEHQPQAPQFSRKDFRSRKPFPPMAGKSFRNTKSFHNRSGA